MLPPSLDNSILSFLNLNHFYTATAATELSWTTERESVESFHIAFAGNREVDLMLHFEIFCNLR
jgi:hypothetical protein